MSQTRKIAFTKEKRSHFEFIPQEWGFELSDCNDDFLEDSDLLKKVGCWQIRTALYEPVLLIVYCDRKQFYKDINPDRTREEIESEIKAIAMSWKSIKSASEKQLKLF